MLCGVVAFLRKSKGKHTFLNASVSQKDRVLPIILCCKLTNFVETKAWFLWWGGKSSPLHPHRIVVHDCRSPLRVDQLGRLSLHTACLPENQLRFRVCWGSQRHLEWKWEFTKKECWSCKTMSLVSKTWQMWLYQTRCSGGNAFLLLFPWVRVYKLLKEWKTRDSDCCGTPGSVFSELQSIAFVREETWFTRSS